MTAAVMKLADEDLSLMEMMGNAYEQIDKYGTLREQAQRSSHEATQAIFQAGRWLSLARPKFRAEGRGKWTAFLKEYGIPRTTGWEAETLFKRAKTEAAVRGMTPTAAKEKFKVVKAKKTKTTSEPMVHSVKASGATADSSESDGVSAPLRIRRPGEPPIDPDSDSGRIIIAPARPKPAAEWLPNPAAPKSDAVEKDAPAPSADAELDVEPTASPSNEPPPGEQHPLLTTIVQIVRRLEVLVEDLPKLNLSAEPKDDIGREIDHGIATLNKLKGGIAR